MLILKSLRKGCGVIFISIAKRELISSISYILSLTQCSTIHLVSLLRSYYHIHSYIFLSGENSQRKRHITQHKEVSLSSSSNHYTKYLLK